MANKKVRNKLSQGLPMQHVAATGLKTYPMKSREVVVMNETHVSQYMLDLQTAGHLSIATTADPVTANVGTDWA